MVESQLAARGITDEDVLEAFRRVPREAFVAPELRGNAFDDSPLGIGSGQTISQPYIVARMIQVAGDAARGRVLEVGTGSGYAAAILARLARSVVTIERIEALARGAEARLRALEVANVQIVVGDGTRGYELRAPYDAILVAAGGPTVPEALQAQLALGGVLVIPVGARTERQNLIRVTRVGTDRYRAEVMDPVLFVPLIGEGAWSPPRDDD